MRFDSDFNIRYFSSLLRNSKQWELLQDKTQVFNERVNSEVKTRGSHSEDVASIAEVLCRELGADATTVSKAGLIGLLHDLGHIAYGHAGESVAADYLENYSYTEQEKKEIFELRKLIYGEKYATDNKKITFEHNENSVLQYLMLCKEHGFEPDKEIITGILSHSTSRYKDLPPELYQQAVRLSDKIAYINYDLQDLFLSFENKPEELAALNDMYDDPLKDPDGKEIPIVLPDGRRITMLEFVNLSTKEKIDMFVMEAVRDAKKQKMNPKEEYQHFDTILTGCNDIVVAMAAKTKAKKKAKTKEEEDSIQREIDQLSRELYERSPLLYAFYEVKNRSDEYIRTGKGLSEKSQAERTFNAESAVGNKDLMNEYIYKSTINYLKTQVELNRGKSEEEVRASYQNSGLDQEIVDFYFGFLDFQNEQNSMIASFPGNVNGYKFPEICTIVNYVGTHSNSQLNSLAKKTGIVAKYEQEVKPLIESLTTSDILYDKSTGKLTKVGSSVRDMLVEHYGAKYKLSYGLDEEDVYPLTSDEVIEKLKQEGFQFEDEELSKEERLERFKTQEKLSEIEVVKHIKSILNRKPIGMQEELVEESGRTL